MWSLVRCENIEMLRGSLYTSLRDMSNIFVLAVLVKVPITKGGYAKKDCNTDNQATVFLISLLNCKQIRRDIHDQGKRDQLTRTWR